MRWWLLICGPLLVVAIPRFDPSALLREVLIPADAAVGSVIYRLRASDTDFAYPLIFTLEDRITVISIDTLNCSRLNSLCHANVVLLRKLEVGRFYDFRVNVRSARGATATLNCSFRATNATTPLGEIFPSAPTLLTISENARRNTELGTLVARGNPSRERPVFLELWGSPLFGLHQRLVTNRNAEGTIILLGKLDYEKSTVHHLTILANDPWTETGKDTRNIATWSILIAVKDEQDTPPVFTVAPPTTLLDPKLRTGDVIVKVHAEDGDKGEPRDIRYDLASDGNPLTSFFNITEDKGEILLVKPLQELQELAPNDKPILITVIAEEVRSNPREQPAQTSTVQLALIPPKPAELKPQFASSEYETKLDENSPPGTKLNLEDLEIVAQAGVVVKLELYNNNGTFEVSPNVVEGRSRFTIRVKDPTLLDYESRHSVHCEIVAKELGDGTNSHTTTAHLTVTINNVDDNPPKFLQDEWHAEIPENSDVGTSVIRIEAYDVEKNRTDTVRYKKLSGPGSHMFHLDEVTGWITVTDSNNLDAEQNHYFELMVEARDDNGNGLPAQSKVIINLLDVNDEVPTFEKNPYEFILNPNRMSFTIPAFVKALDNDVTSPNNEVRYEFIEVADNLTINAVSGEITVKGVWSKNEAMVYHVRGYDGGVPRLWSETEVKIYPPETVTKKMVFIVSGKNPDRQLLADTLTTIVGGPVMIDDVRPYRGQIENGAIDISRGSEKDRSIVSTTIHSGSDVNIDIERVHRILDSKETHETTIKESSSGSLSWLLILLLVIILLIVLVLILCCICEPCPLYIPPKRRKVASSEVSKLVVQGTGEGKESKAIQVAEWFGRKEAWTPDGITVENETDSLKKHEIERGSDRGGRRHSMQRQHIQQQESGRDQFYIREGNADILRLITRQGQEQLQQRPITLVGDQPYVIDSGKDILMRRFIDQQQAEAVRGTGYLPNAVTKLQNEQELLEASLRQQNALLRQILIERERDLRLETQSLPAGTQTDHDAGTQTEPLYLRPPRRRVRSDNDASEGSDDDASSKYRRKSRRGRKTTPIRRQIRTPIQEEPESNIESYERQQKSHSSKLNYAQTRSSILRQKAADSGKSRSAIRKEVLREISASLNQSDDSESDNKTYSKERDEDEESYTDDSLDEFTPRSGKSLTSSKFHRYSSETDLRSASPKKLKTRKKSLSQTDLSMASSKPKQKGSKRGTSRYMEWYKKGAKDKDSGGGRGGDRSGERGGDRSGDRGGTRGDRGGERGGDKGGERGVDRSGERDVKGKSKQARIKRSDRSTTERSNDRSSKDKSPRRKLSFDKSIEKAIEKSTVEKSGVERNNIERSGVEKYAGDKKKPTIEDISKEKLGSKSSKSTDSSGVGTKDAASGAGPEHHLVQHSERRFEPFRRPEEDADSGIALARPAMAEKKSVFTIRYDDMHTSQLRPESATTPPL